jgi:YhcH/YjgK/YiaL family protein
MIEGEERIGISNKDECKIIDEYDELEDFANVAGSFDLITLKKNYFAIFYPQDAHLPCLKIAKEANKVKKIVFKVPV